MIHGLLRLQHPEPSGKAMSMSVDALFMALYLLYLCQIVFGTVPQTSTSGLFESMIHSKHRSVLHWLWKRLAAIDLTVLLRIEKKTCDFVESGGDVLSISWQ